MKFNTTQDVMILVWTFLSGVALISSNILTLIFACSMLIATLLSKQIKLMEDSNKS